MQNKLTVRMDEDTRNILDNIARECGFDNTSSFVRNKLIEIANDYIDVSEYIQIKRRVENKTEKVYSFEEAMDEIL